MKIKEVNKFIKQLKPDLINLDNQAIDKVRSFLWQQRGECLKYLRVKVLGYEKLTHFCTEFGFDKGNYCRAEQGQTDPSRYIEKLKELNEKDTI